MNQTGFNWSGAAHGETKRSPDGAVVAYAGPLAEARIAGINVIDAELIDGRMPAGKGDADMAKWFAAQNALEPYVARARALIGHEAIWRAISSLACALCNPVRLKKAALRDIPPDIRAEVLPGCGDRAFDDRYYNTRRRHSALDYLTPEEFEARHRG